MGVHGRSHRVTVQGDSVRQRRGGPAASREEGHREGGLVQWVFEWGPEIIQRLQVGPPKRVQESQAEGVM